MVDSGRAREQLDRILGSKEFVAAPKLSRFLRFCVERELAGEREFLKESSVGASVFDRPVDYDPKIDPIVRVQAGRLRAKLDQYYGNGGSADPVRIEIPRGAYVPAISLQPMPAAPEVPAGRPQYYAAASAVLLLAAVCLVVWLSPKRHSTGSNTGFSPVPFNTLPGNKRDLAWSPDGKSLAFAWDGEDGSYHVYSEDIHSAEAIRLSDQKSEAWRPAWSPSGSEIAWIRNLGEGRIAYVRHDLRSGVERTVGEGAFYMSLLGDTPLLDWSPDGRQLLINAQSAPGAPVRLRLLPKDGGDARDLTSPPDQSTGDMEARFSPDGRNVAFRRGGVGDLLLVDVERGEASAKPLTQDNRGVRGLTWVDGNSLLFGSQREALGYGIFTVRLDTRAIRPVTPPGWEAVEPAIQPHGENYAMVQKTTDMDLTEIEPGTGRLRYLPVSSRDETQPAYSSDGSAIVFASTRSGAREIWTAKSNGSAARQLTSYDGRDLPMFPSWSPDGRSVVFSLREHGLTNLMRVDVGTRNVTRLTDVRDRRLFAVYSGDGKSLFFNSNAGGMLRIWRMAADGSGEPQVAVSEPAANALPSGDGRSLYYLAIQSRRLMQKNLANGIARVVWNGEINSPIDWVIAGGHLFVLSARGAASDREILDIDPTTGTERSVFRISRQTESLDGRLAVKPDRSKVMIPTVRHSSQSIYLAKLPTS